jgi:hypothetical protein
MNVQTQSRETIIPYSLTTTFYDILGMGPTLASEIWILIALESNLTGLQALMQVSTDKWCTAMNRIDLPCAF